MEGGISFKHTLYLFQDCRAIQVDIGQNNKHALSTVLHFLDTEFFKFREGTDRVEDIRVF